MLIVLILVLLTCIWIEKLIYNQYYTPVTILSCAWFGMGIVYSTGLFEYYKLSSNTWLVYFLSYFMFLAGSTLMASIYQKRGSTLTKAPAPEPNLSEYFSQKRLRKATGLLFYIALFSGFLQSYLFVLTYGLSGFLNMWLVKENIASRILGNFVYLNSLVVVMIFFYLFLYKTSRREKLKYYIQVLLMFVLIATSYNKSGIIRTIVWVFFVYCLIHKKSINIKKLLIAVVIVFVFFIAFSNILSPYYYGDYRFWVRDNVVHLPETLKGLSFPLFYISGSLPALNTRLEVLSISQDYSNGVYTFRPLISLMNLVLPGIGIPETDSIRYAIGPRIETNVYTYLRPFLDDFGIAGCIIGPFFVGIIANWGFCKLKYLRKHEYLLTTAFMFWILSLTFFSNHLIYNYNIMYLVVSYFVCRYARNPKPYNISVNNNN